MKQNICLQLNTRGWKSGHQFEVWFLRRTTRTFQLRFQIPFSNEEEGFSFTEAAQAENTISVCGGFNFS